MLPVPEGISYENVFRVMIVQFLDPYNFDVRSVKRSCIHIVHPDGRIIPFDTFNMFYREGSAGYHLVIDISNGYAYLSHTFDIHNGLNNIICKSRI
jgi:hypothetical protein